MRSFELVSDFSLTGDQPRAIESLQRGLRDGLQDQVLLGVTGSGKTFTIANLIAREQRPALVLAHNKTLAAQLYQEFRRLFPHNAVEYFVSYYDYYQPEAYVPQSDTYIEKEATINEEIDRMRHSATRALFERRDVLIVASVSCIYGLGSPEAYHGMMLLLERGMTVDRDAALRKLVEIQYERTNADLRRGAFRVRGDTVEIWPSYAEDALRVEFWGDEIESIARIDPVRGAKVETLDRQPIYPNSHYVTPRETLVRAMKAIRAELVEHVASLERAGEAARGAAPAAANDVRPRDARRGRLLPRDRELLPPPDGALARRAAADADGLPARRLPAGRRREPRDVAPGARDVPRRPFAQADAGRARFPPAVGHGQPPADLRGVRGAARPDDLRLGDARASSSWSVRGGQIVEQVVRPTGLLDPPIDVRPIEGQVDDLLAEIRARVERGERTLVTTLTKRMAEDLTEYYRDVGVRVEYLHSEVQTLERVRILRDLRKGEFDVLVGVNLLREGLDLPEVSLVAILDADKEGYLRSECSLIQTIGRAARHLNGTAILYADRITGSMRRALDETARRRVIQQAYNEEHGITPESISRALDELMGTPIAADYSTVPIDQPRDEEVFESLDALDREVAKLEKRMLKAAERLDFEEAAEHRDRIRYLRRQAVISGA